MGGKGDLTLDKIQWFKLSQDFQFIVVDKGAETYSIALAVSEWSPFDQIRLYGSWCVCNVMSKMQDSWGKKALFVLLTTGATRTFSDIHPERLNLDLEGPLFCFRRHILDTDHGSCEDVSHKCAFRNMSMALSTKCGIWMAAFFVFRWETWWESIKHLLPFSGTL